MPKVSTMNLARRYLAIRDVVAEQDGRRRRNRKKMVLRRFISVLLYACVLPMSFALGYLLFQFRAPPLSSNMFIAAFQVGMIAMAALMAAVIVVLGPLSLLGGIANLLWRKRL